MSRITIAIAEEVAEKITKPLEDKVVEAEAKFSEETTLLMEKRIPKEVRIAIEKHPKWFSSRESIQLHENGFHRRDVKLTRKVCFQDHWTSTANVTKAEAATLCTLDREVDKAKDKAAKAYRDIRQTLINLRTYKRVQDEFPEAYPLLPLASTITTVMVVPKTVRGTDCLPCVRRKTLPGKEIDYGSIFGPLRVRR